MNTKTFGFATLMCAIASTVLAAPAFNDIPGGVVSGKWVWNIDITPDLTLVPDIAARLSRLNSDFA